MKKILLVGGLFIMLLFVSNPAMAKNKDFFVGTWNVVVKDTPMGDSKLTIVLNRKSGKLQGYVINKDGNQSPIEKIEEKGQVVVICFVFSHFDVDPSMQKKDENKFVGKLK